MLADAGYSPLFTLFQQHGDAIIRLRRPFVCPDFDTLIENQPNGDAVVTDRPGFFIGVKSADCVPVLMYDGKAGAVAAVHAGWRGTALEIAGKTAAVMREEFGAEEIRAAIGPCICRKCFVTKGDVPEAMPSLAGEFIERIAPDRYHVDLAGINAAMLRKNGVLSVEVPPACTCCNPGTYWSHRAHGSERGLQVSLIGISGGEGV